MKHLVILGAGTGGTIVANRMSRALGADWTIQVVDPAERHLYQPGLLFLPFGARGEERLSRPRGATLARRVDWVRQAVQAVETDGKRVVLADGSRLPYDLLVVATGAELRPAETEGMLSPHWRDTVHEFYTLPGAVALRGALDRFRGGRLVVDVVDMPIKCPVAPLEFLFLADDFLARRGLRDRVELVYATPLDGAFTKPLAAAVLGPMLAARGIRMEPLFAAASIDGDRRELVSWDERRIAYDLLVTVPLHGGAPFLAGSGLADEMGFVRTEPRTLLAKGRDDVFALGDATDLPASKAGSVAHFESEVVAENLLRAVAGRGLAAGFDGHANCFVESGGAKALLIDFNYDVEPLPGRYPLPGVGPFRLLGESRMNHLGKLAFRFLYWNALLPGRPLPVPGHLSMAGKRPPKGLAEAA